MGTGKYEPMAAEMIAQLKYGSGRRSGRSWKTPPRRKPARNEPDAASARGGAAQRQQPAGTKGLKLGREPAEERTRVFTSAIVYTAAGPKIARYFHGGGSMPAKIWRMF